MANGCELVSSPESNGEYISWSDLAAGRMIGSLLKFTTPSTPPVHRPEEFTPVVFIDFGHGVYYAICTLSKVWISSINFNLG